MPQASDCFVFFLKSQQVQHFSSVRRCCRRSALTLCRTILTQNGRRDRVGEREEEKKKRERDRGERERRRERERERESSHD